MSRKRFRFQFALFRFDEDFLLFFEKEKQWLIFAKRIIFKTDLSNISF